ncbi:MAG: hypothetical protein V3R55_02870, partial [Alphaproteobacteria bacterium]
DRCPRVPERVALPRGLAPVVDLFKVLLKMKCEAADVAQKLVASNADLELIAVDDGAEVAALSGWRREVFGEDALALKHGRLALTIEGKALKLVPSARETSVGKASAKGGAAALAQRPSQSG